MCTGKQKPLDPMEEILCCYCQVAAKLLQSCPTLCDPWTAAHQAPPSMGFSRQEYWSGLPLPSPVGNPLMVSKSYSLG